MFELINNMNKSNNNNNNNNNSNNNNNNNGRDALELDNVDVFSGQNAGCSLRELDGTP